MIINPYVFGITLTSRTTAFKNATGITDVTILNALNDLDLGLTSNGLDSKITCLYPFAGGDSTKHSYNFMNPSSYQINWSSGVIHSSLGVKFNGTSSFGDTNLKPSNFGSQNDRSYFWYHDSDTQSTLHHYLGVNYLNRLYTSYQSGIYYYSISSSSQGGYTAGSVQNNKLLVANRTSSTNTEFYVDGAMVDNDAVTSTTIPDINVYIGGSNGNTGSVFSPTLSRFKIAGFGSSLTSTDISNLKTINDTFQNALGRL